MCCSRKAARQCKSRKAGKHGASYVVSPASVSGDSRAREDADSGRRVTETQAVGLRGAVSGLWVLEDQRGAEGQALPYPGRWGSSAQMG